MAYCIYKGNTYIKSGIIYCCRLDIPTTHKEDRGEEEEGAVLVEGEIQWDNSENNVGLFQDYMDMPLKGLSHELDWVFDDINGQI